MQRLVWALIAALVACSARPERAGREPEAVPAAGEVASDSSAARSDATVYCSLETRDRVVTIFIGGLYSVKTKDGQVLAEQIDDAALARDFPELGTLVKEGVDTNDMGSPITDLGYTSETDSR